MPTEQRKRSLWLMRPAVRALAMLILAPWVAAVAAWFIVSQFGKSSVPLGFIAGAVAGFVVIWSFRTAKRDQTQ